MSATATRDRDPRDPFVDGLELPRGLERELVQDERENLYKLNGEDARMLATIGAFRIVAEHDLDDVRDPSADPHDDTLDYLADEELIRFVDVDADERAAVLTDQGWDVLDANRTMTAARSFMRRSGESASCSTMRNCSPRTWRSKSACATKARRSNASCWSAICAASIRSSCRSATATDQTAMVARLETSRN
jgi:hypothetical protein